MTTKTSVESRGPRIRVPRPSIAVAIGTFLLVISLGTAFLGPLFRPYNPNELVASPLLKPSRAYPLGTDEIGRDLFSRVLSGGLEVLLVALLATIVAFAFGAALGMTSGYVQGRFDIVVTRSVDLLIALPPLLLAIVFISSFGSSLHVLVIVTSMFFVPRIIRIVRGVTVPVVANDYVKASRLRGLSTGQIVWRDLVPNIAGILVVEFAARLGSVIMFVATLNFLRSRRPAPFLQLGSDGVGNSSIAAEQSGSPPYRNCAHRRAHRWRQPAGRRVCRPAGDGPVRETECTMTEFLHLAPSENDLPVLDIRGLEVEYRGREGGVTTVKDFALTAARGVIYGIVGESGSGKSTVGLAGIGWASAELNRTAGSSSVLGTAILDLPQRSLRKLWGQHVGYVPQEVGGALHPSFRIRRQFRESMRINRGAGKDEADERAVELLRSAGIPDPQAALKRYPHEFSGGQLQRIAIALALAPRPDLLVLDEPTTALDVTTQRIVVDALRKLATEERVAVLFISHDIALLCEYADELVVMYAGEIVEHGSVTTVLSRPRHPYTRALVDAVPSPGRTGLPASIPGLPPGRVVEGACAFAPRCSHVTPRCREEKPSLTAISANHVARCCRVSELTLSAATEHAEPVARASGDVILTARDIVVEYDSHHSSVRAVDGVSLTLRKGNLTALVGESGSGKSSLGHVIAGLNRPTSGSIEFDGVELPADPMRRTKLQRRSIQLVFQGTSGSLNPRRTVGDHLRHVAACFLEPARRQAAVEEVLESVQLSNQLLDRYPSKLSGGQKQRVAIASAFLADPTVVICDEITSGQDVSVQAAILETLARMQTIHDTAVLLISHDLGVVRAIADDVYVMRRGSVAEQGRTDDLFTNPQHDYTRDLLAAAPHSLDPTGRKHAVHTHQPPATLPRIHPETIAGDHLLDPAFDDQEHPLRTMRN
ncbi:hypothetical protein A0W34_32420 (plasmid) [Rhodococcus sp. BH4]|uniref:ABC transporter ATP-binding protein/permease n=1 Tax=Rhodococcus sp. BH4 TaxID=1807790 RepID=UPI0009C3A6CB|nr:dipeptide ABC transporter ATP-binding protein [Rhodococcus sp. BH4]ARE38172.1 hypothetical protein A0W34_32420 [Rhodococcus sp. BH4]